MIFFFYNNSMNILQLLKFEILTKTQSDNIQRKTKVKFEQNIRNKKSVFVSTIFNLINRYIYIYIYLNTCFVIFNGLINLMI